MSKMRLLFRSPNTCSTREMQPSPKGVIFDVVGVILHLAEVGQGAILALRAFGMGRAYIALEHEHGDPGPLCLTLWKVATKSLLRCHLFDPRSSRQFLAWSRGE
jgi:hypothetical protein